MLVKIPRMALKDGSSLKFYNMKKIFLNIAAMALGISFIPQSFADPNINRVMDKIMMKQDYFDNCQFNEYEKDIDILLETSVELSSHQYSTLLSAKSSIHMCRNEYSAQYKIDMKITSLPLNEISKNVYMYAMTNSGIGLNISSQSEMACKYLTKAASHIDDNTPVFLKTYVNHGYANICINDPVKKLKVFYKMLKQFSVVTDDRQLKQQKEIILHSIADEYADIEQFPTAAKIRKDAMDVFPEEDGSQAAFQDHYALGNEYLDAGDIRSAEEVLEQAAYHASFNKDNELVNELLYVYRLKLAYAKRDYALMIRILDSMGSMIDVIEGKYNTNKISVLKAIACLMIGRKPCVDNFVNNLDYHKSQIQNNEYLLTSFLTRYYISIGDVKNSLAEYDNYAESFRVKLFKQQDFNTVLGTAQLHNDIIELDLNLARGELKQSQLITMLITGLSILFLMFALMFWYSRNRQRHYAETDLLSNLLNRRAMLASLKSLKPASGDNHHALVLFDLDKFKRVNDTYGHHIGDKVIQSVGKITNKNIRKHDTLGRIGGEEFLLCLTDIPYEEAKKTVERIRQSLEETLIPIDNKTNISVTASFSFVLFDVENTTFEKIFPTLDDGLYQAKDAGRNTVIEVSS